MGQKGESARMWDRIVEMEMKIVDIKPGLESLKSRVEDLELARTAHENELASNKPEMSAL